MRKRYVSKSKSRFVRWWQSVNVKSVLRCLLLLITSPVWIAKVILFGVLGLTIVFEVWSAPSAWRLLKRVFREAVVIGQTDYDSTRLKGGEARQTGSGRKGSLVRSGGPLSSDDLRRRLYELRTPKTERMNRRTPITGGQNGKQ